MEAFWLERWIIKCYFRKIILIFWLDWSGKVKSSVKTGILCVSEVIRKSIRGNYKLEGL